MKTLRIVLLVAIIGLFIIPVQAQYTKQQANDLVLTQILNDDLDRVDVFMSASTKSNQEAISLGNNTSVILPYANN